MRVHKGFIREASQLLEMLEKAGASSGDMLYVHSAKVALVGTDTVVIEFEPSDDGESLDVVFVDGEWGAS